MIYLLLLQKYTAIIEGFIDDDIDESRNMTQVDDSDDDNDTNASFSSVVELYMDIHRAMGRFDNSSTGGALPKRHSPVEKAAMKFLALIGKERTKEEQES